MVRLMAPNGDGYDIVVGSAGERLEHNGLELAFRDRRRARARGGGGRTHDPAAARRADTVPSTAQDPLDPFYQPQVTDSPTRDWRPSVGDLHDQRTMDVPYPPAQYPPTSADDDWLH